MNKEAQAFWACCKRTGACLQWFGSWDNHLRSGRWRWRGKRELAHRTAWRLLRGNVPAGLVLVRLCSTPRCVEPQHYAAVSRSELAVARRGDIVRETLPVPRNNARLDVQTAIEAWNAVRYGLSTRRVAKELGLSRSTVWAITTGRSWNG